MMTFAAFLLAVSLAVPNQQEPSIRAFGGSPDLDRASTRVVYFDSAQQRFLGEIAIAYGRPQWRQDYNDSERFDSVTRGQQIRLGKNFWTSLDTNLELNMGGRSVAPGLYYLGLGRSHDDEWHLLLFDPEQVRSLRLDASQTAQAEPLMRIPVSKSTSAISKEELTISLSYDQSDPGKMTLRVEWGPHMLATSLSVDLGNEE
ncbi:MAG TPA: DUF2911 domain-containing protein [Acidobacteriota bacterium]|nr:DUF2911 domain-containing protein [Acidobacteriota bacterium]